MTVDSAGPEDIRYAYRLLLGREPDASGLETYSRLVHERIVLPHELAGYFLGSSEFRNRSGNGPHEVDLDGFVLFVRRDDSDVGRSIAQSRQWEPHVVSAMGERLGAGGRFLDVGANIGYFTAWAAHRVGSTGRVVAIEPMDKNLQLIYAMISRNGFAHVRVEPFAASDVPATIGMSTFDGSSNGEIRGDWAPGSHPLYAQTRRLDELLADEARFDVVKFDVEGHELNAWRGFSRTLQRDRPIVLTEFHPRCLRQNAQVEPAEYGAVLFDYGVIIVLNPDGTRSSCRDFDTLMRLWAREDTALGTDGAAHLDLLVEPRS